MMGARTRSPRRPVGALASLGVALGVALAVALGPLAAAGAGSPPGAAPRAPRTGSTAPQPPPPHGADPGSTAAARPRAIDPRTGDHLIERSRPAMGTIVHITAWANDDASAVRAMEEAFAELARVEARFTTWRADSEISRVNAAAGARAVTVSDETLRLLRRAVDVSRITRGAFDVTVGAYQGLWKFDEDKDGSIPDEAEVAARRALLGWRDIAIDARRRTVRLRRPGQRITLGGIAKGYAVDRAIAILRRRGLADFIVQAGGDLYVSGRRGDRPWRVGIRDPRGGDDAFFAVAEVEDRTFSTSGDYERYLVIDGRRYHHILDPATGHPARRSRSVTVMARDATTADALSTALFVLGPEAGMALVERLPDVDAMFVGADNRVTISSGLRGRVRLLRPPTDGP